MVNAPRGGKRAGAGRKPRLSALQQLEVGTHIHRKLEEAKGRKPFAYSESDALLVEGIEKRHGVLKSMTREERARWAKLWRGGGIDDDESPLDTLIRDIGANAQRLALVKGPTVRRGYGVRGVIIKEAARHFSQLYGVTISERMATRCLDEWRRIANRLAV